MRGRGRGVTREIHPSRPPAELPDDPEEIVARILDAERRGELYPLYHRLRSLAPAHSTQVAGLPPGCWMLTRFRYVDRVARSPAAVNDPRTAEVFNHGGDGGAFYQLMRHAMLFLEKPDHDRVRRLVYKAFTPAAVAPVRALTEQVAHELLDAAQPNGEMDFVEQFSYPLPVRAIMRLLGLPYADQERIEEWAWDFSRAGDPMSATPEIVERGNAAARGFHDYFERVIEGRRSRPGEDLISALVTAEEDGGRLSREEAISTCVLLLQAGHETTSDLLGNALVGLFRHPSQLARLRDEPELLPPAVEELLRYDTSVQMSMRLIREDLRLDGVTLPAGSIAALVYGAANRDPEQFDRPDRLDLERRPTHLSLSAGSYFCLGNALARTEIQAGLRVLLDRVPSIRPARDTFVQRRTARLRGPQELMVRWDA
ncbi:MAG: cytochrome P450 [Proteobacteria bacterium]|nr:cytochrome P450 [Pseudomonadota bacterium]